MWLVLSDASDPASGWLAHGLHERGVTPVESITIEELIFAERWVHTLGDGGPPEFRVELADGRRIDSLEVSGAVNRIGYIPPVAMSRIDEADREYVAQELHAFFLSVLASLPGVVLNPATPRGLGGAWRHRSEWVALAAAAGLRTDPLRSSEMLTTQFDPPPVPAGPMAITVGGEIVDTGLDDDVVAACLLLAELAETPMLGIDFRIGADGEPVFVRANPRPPLEIAGDAVLDALSHRFLNGDAP